MTGDYTIDPSFAMPVTPVPPSQPATPAGLDEPALRKAFEQAHRAATGTVTVAGHEWPAEPPRKDLADLVAEAVRSLPGYADLAALAEEERLAFRNVEVSISRGYRFVFDHLQVRVVGDLVPAGPGTEETADDPVTHIRLDDLAGFAVDEWGQDGDRLVVKHDCDWFEDVTEQPAPLRTTVLQALAHRRAGCEPPR